MWKLFFKWRKKISFHVNRNLSVESYFERVISKVQARRNLRIILKKQRRSDSFMAESGVQKTKPDAKPSEAVGSLQAAQITNGCNKRIIT